MVKELLFETEYEVPKHASKKNSRPLRFNRKTKKMFIGKSDGLVALEHLHLTKLNFAKIKHNIIHPFNETLELRVTLNFPETRFYKKTKKNEPQVMNKTIGDNSNLSQIIEDCLEKVGIVENDVLFNPVIITKKPHSLDLHSVEISIYKKLA